MSILLDDLVTELAEDVPAEDGVPSTAQYEKAVLDAARAFSERCGVEQIATLSVVSGTAAYDLPADFLSLIALVGLTIQDDVLITSGGLIPYGSTWEERFTIRNGQITFSPTPTYTLARELRYKAAWIATIVDDEYDNTYEFATLTEREKRIVMLKAEALALKKLANVSSGMKYSLGSVSFDGSGTGTGLLADAKAKDEEFEAECRKYNGTAMGTS